MIYDTLLGTGIYLPYAVGYLEILELKQNAENFLGDAFVTRIFTDFFLILGYSSGDQNYMDVWMGKNTVGQWNY